MTQPPTPPDEPIGGALTPEPPDSEADATPPPPPVTPPPPPGEASYPPPPPPPAPSAMNAPPPPPPAGGAYPPPPPSGGAYPPPPGGATYPPPPPSPGGFPSAPGYSYPAAGVGLTPHRGTMVLVLGILGIACCSVLSIPAFLMSKADLAAMDAGTMDPTGRGVTSAARILGIVGMVFLAIGVAYLIFILGIGLLSAGNS